MTRLLPIVLLFTIVFVGGMTFRIRLDDQHIGRLEQQIASLQTEKAQLLATAARDLNEAYMEVTRLQDEVNYWIALYQSDVAIMAGSVHVDKRLLPICLPKEE